MLSNLAYHAHMIVDFWSSDDHILKILHECCPLFPKYMVLGLILLPGYANYHPETGEVGVRILSSRESFELKNINLILTERKSS